MAERHGGHSRHRPVPPRGQFKRAPFAWNEQQPGGAVGYVAQGPDHALVQRRAVSPGKPDGAGKAQPLCPVVIAVLEQVLDQRHPQPAAQARGKRGQDPRQRNRRYESDLQQSRIVAAGKGKPLRHGDHDRQVAADQQERDCLERHRARRLEPQAFALFHRPQRQQPGGRNSEQSAQQGNHLRIGVRKIGYRIEVQIDDPQQRRCNGRPANDQARLLRRPCIKVVDQHQAANGNQQAQRNQRMKGKPGRDRHLPQRQDQEDCDLQELHESQRGKHGPNRPDRSEPSIHAEEAIERKDPGQVAQALGQSDRAGFQACPGSGHQPQRGKPDGDIEGGISRTKPPAPPLQPGKRKQAGKSAHAPEQGFNAGWKGERPEHGRAGLA